jgi:hypothetical protein
MRNAFTFFFSLLFVLLGAALIALAALRPEVPFLGQLTLHGAGVFLLLISSGLVAGRHTMGLAFENSLKLLKVLLTVVKR